MNHLKKTATGFKVTEESIDDSIPCILSKSKRRSYESSQNRATRPGERVHFDIGVVNVESFQDFKYYILFVDDFSIYSIMFPLKGESEEYIKHHILGLFNKFSIYPKFIKSDNALEFSTNSLEEFLFSKGIQHQTSCDYTHEQVGIVNE
jgi:hypothetical protein